ncbi:MAG: hypothetical protein Pg6C_17010 [Treponemataceae bacterium]|nr:MAG: hypothetical protein Pg6C_17010 [Treponemataceae bacterium]
MVRVKIDVDRDILLQLQQELAKLAAGTMPATARVMNIGAHLVQKTWRGYAQGGSLPGISENLKRPSGGYARSIKVQMNGPFDYEVYSEAKIAEWIENGTEEIDMKETHTRGPRSRVSKKGVPYLIVPFRWGTAKNTVGFKNIIPEAVYNMIRNKEQFERSTVLNTTHDEPNASGEQAARREYDWGDRLTGIDYVDPNLEGMAAMDTGSSKKQHTGYFTFRVISADSPARSWIKPAMPARHVTQAVAKVTEEAISGMVESAVREDLGL